MKSKKRKKRGSITGPDHGSCLKKLEAFWQSERRGACQPGFHKKKKGRHAFGEHKRAKLGQKKPSNILQAGANTFLCQSTSLSTGKCVLDKETGVLPADQYRVQVGLFRLLGEKKSFPTNKNNAGRGEQEVSQRELGGGTIVSRGRKGGSERD